ncbi:hypothetical protein QOZ80_2BG0197850 [Eleusine coracana subsp. coracana]|nr:hypothetical protein QOZ80_2BG0197850 [Eleusine coracana subsp. coracana]
MRSEAGDISGSHDNVKKKTPFGKGLATINYNDLEDRAVPVWSWACVSFSSLSATQILGFLYKLTEKCNDLGMDITHEPTFFSHATTYSHHTDIQYGLLSARKLFCVQKKEMTKLLVVVQDDAVYYDDDLDDMCQNFGVAYHSCCCSLEPIKSLVVGPIILFGAGVSHDISSQTVSVVASMKWPEIITYRGRAICSKELTIDFSLARCYLEDYCKTNGKRAERIMFFRHVESPLNELVVTGDIIALKKASESISKEYQPPITYIAVSTNKNNVISPATVCDDVGLNSTTKFGFSCDPWEEETATAHYGVFLDENSFSPCVLEYFCLNLCTPFYRWAMPAMPMVPPASLAATIAQDKLRESEE